MIALIIGIFGEEVHDNLVRDMVVKGFNDSGGNISISDVGLQLTASLEFQQGYDYCIANNIPLMGCSYVGASSIINIALSNYPDVTTVMPAGSNVPSDLVFDHIIPSVILITGGGDESIGNETGINIEFFANDYTTPETTPDEQDLSSFSNGYILGQIAYIMAQRNCNSWEARYCAKMTGSENGVWDSNNGFGFIDTDLAIAYSGIIANDSFGVHLDYSLEATRSGVKIKFNLIGSKTIYRKTSYETDWTEVATTTSDVYLDAVNRSPKIIHYKVGTVKKNILYTKIDKLYKK